MATTFTYKIGGQYSDIVLGYVNSTDIGYCFREMVLTKTDSMVLGSVLKADGTEATAAANAEVVLVWTDALIGDFDMIETGEQFAAVVAKTGATLNRYKLVYANGDLINDAGVAALEAKGLKVTNKVIPTT